MSKEIRYTTDGKKVIVVGKLNSQETIVQEIFIINENEIPSGENFVVKSLHDAPAVSWKESEIKKLEARFEKEQKEWIAKIDSLKKTYSYQSNLFKEKIDYIGRFLKEASEDSFNLLVDYITGKITHIVEVNYNCRAELLTIEAFNETYEGKLRLISFFGRDNGNMKYAIGKYRDFSGSDTEFFAYKSYQEAIDKVREITLSNSVTEQSLSIADKYGFSFPPEKIEAYKESCRTGHLKTLESLQAKIKDVTAQLEKL